MRNQSLTQTEYDTDVRLFKPYLYMIAVVSFRNKFVWV